MHNIIEKYKSSPVQIRASLWFLFCSFLQKGISFITTPIFTRILTTDEYGEFGVFMSWSGIVNPIISLSLSAGVYSQGLVKFDNERGTFSSSLQGLTLTMISCWTAIYYLFHDFFNSFLGLTTIQVLLMVLMIWLSTSFSFWSMDQRVDFRYRNLVLITVIVSVLQPLLGIILILNSKDKVFARILGMVIIQVIFYAWTFFYHQIKGKQFYSGKFWPYALKFNLPLLPHYLSLTVLASSDRIMIDRLVGTSEAGIYNLAYSVSMIMVMFNTALLQTIEPWIYKKLKVNKGNDLAKVAYPTFLTIFLVNIALIALAPEVIKLFAPAEYYEAIWVVPSVAMSVFFMYLYTFFATFEFYYEKTKYVTGATVGGALLNIVLNYIFIRIYGYVAAGYTTLFSYILFAFLHYYFMRKICKKYINDLHPYNVKVLLGISCGTLIAGFSLQFTYNMPILRYLLAFAGLIISFIMRKQIINKFKQIISIRKRESD